MTIDTRYTAAIRNALLEQMHDASSRVEPDGSRAAAPGNQPQAGTDTVVLSDAARRVHDAVHAATTGSDVDWQRIDALRAAIFNGTYNIDPTRVADKLFRLDSEL